MKIIIIIIGVLCLLAFSNKGIGNAHNYPTQYDIDGQAHLDNSPSNAHWDFENTQNMSQGIAENASSVIKRRVQETNSKSSYEAQGQRQSLPRLHSLDQSRINLFLIYHFSLSLWEVFLQ